MNQSMVPRAAAPNPDPVPVTGSSWVISAGSGLRRRGHREGAPELERVGVSLGRPHGAPRLRSGFTSLSSCREKSRYSGPLRLRSSSVAVRFRTLMVTWKTRASATAGTHTSQAVMRRHMLCAPCPPERLFFWGDVGYVLRDRQRQESYTGSRGGGHGRKEPADPRTLLSQSRGGRDRSRCPTPAGTGTQLPQVGSEGPSRQPSPHLPAPFTRTASQALTPDPTQALALSDQCAPFTQNFPGACTGSPT